MSRGEAPDFRNAPLGDGVAVGLVEPRAARLWLRTEEPGTVRLCYWREREPEALSQADVRVRDADGRDRTTSVRLPDAGPGAAPLVPGTAYRFTAVRLVPGGGDPRPLGQGRFRTAPASADDAPERVAFGLMSCHQPFDRDGRVAPHAEDMLRVAIEVLERHRASFVLQMGDQVYTDWPPSLSLVDEDHFRRVAPPGRERLTDCTAAEVRALVQRRYRHFFALDGWRELCARFPCLPILDDHEIVDNWGSDPAHAVEPWRSVGEGARLAYLDYQGSRVRPPEEGLPPDFDFSLDHGPLAVHVIDLRSSRRAADEPRLLSAEQHARFERFLATHGETPVLALVLSVPIVHLPRPVARVVARATPPGEDFSDRWSSAAHVADRDRVLRALHRHQTRHPGQRVLLLSGDIHIGCVHEVRWQDGPVMHQVVSSGITNRMGSLVRNLSMLSILANRGITVDGEEALSARVRPARTVDGGRRIPYRGLNLGVVELARAEGGGWDVDLLLYGRGGRRVHRTRLPAAASPSGTSASTAARPDRPVGARR